MQICSNPVIPSIRLCQNLRASVTMVRRFELQRARHDHDSRFDRSVSLFAVHGGNLRL